ncbi:hypothetical protein [Streptomyces sp. NPDC047070]|uniref:hypothetical protein n=1 Tax=Streptomyces sp. NPDC047070 TaxID=3154923 RepID=UPI003456ADE9
MSRRMNAERAFSVSTWLLAAAGDPTAARRQWDSSGVAMLDCGKIFDAARVPAHLVHRVAGSTDPDRITEYLDHALFGGAVIVDVQDEAYYFLVQHGASMRWNMPDTKCLGQGRSLGVPLPGASPRGGRRARASWALEMFEPGALSVTGAVMQLVHHARLLWAQEERVEASHG